MEEDGGPSWLGLSGYERLEAEHAALRRDVRVGRLPGVTKARRLLSCRCCLAPPLPLALQFMLPRAPPLPPALQFMLPLRTPLHCRSIATGVAAG